MALYAKTNRGEEMIDFTQYVRVQRSVACAHGEAFQIMLYTSKEVGGPDVWVWNSRDGVTPFGADFQGRKYHHAMNGYLPTYSAVLPDDVEFVWVSYTPVTWEAMQRENYRRYAEVPDDKPYGGADFRERFPTVEGWLAITPFEHGQPRLVTREEYLAETPEWMGRAGIEAAISKARNG